MMQFLTNQTTNIAEIWRMHKESSSSFISKSLSQKSFNFLKINSMVIPVCRPYSTGMYNRVMAVRAFPWRCCLRFTCFVEEPKEFSFATFLADLFTDEAEVAADRIVWLADTVVVITSTRVRAGGALIARDLFTFLTAHRWRASPVDDGRRDEKNQVQNTDSWYKKFRIHRV